MALQVWLPLNGNLNNQGIFQLPTPLVNNINFINNGKIGKASSRYCIYHLSSDIVTNSWSLACWCKSSSWQQYNDILLCNNTSTSDDCRFYFSIVGGSRLNIGINGPSSTGYANYQFSTNTWYHVAATYDGTNYALYINGDQVKTGQCTTTIPSNKLNLGIQCRSTSADGSSTTTGSANLNDVRIYDHCLSAKEVKEIAKGLVLNYRLAGYGGANIYKDMSNFNLSGSDFPSISTRILGKITITGSTQFNAHRWAESYMNPNSSTIINNTKTYTISADIKTTGLTSAMTAKFEFDFRRSDHSQLVKGSVALNPKYNGQWHRYSATLTGTAQSQIKNLICFTGTAANGLVIEYKNFKLEEGSVATPWIPNSADSSYSALGLNSTTEFDCSGYSNNGTKTGTITCDSDTPRYTTSYKFGSTSTKIKLPVITYTNFGNSYTFSWWQKNTSSDNMPWGFSDGNRLNFYHTSYLCWNTGDGSSNPFKDSNGNPIPSSRLCDSQWHHCAIVGNGSSTILYIDGINAGTATTYKPLTGTQIYISGWDSGTGYTFNGSNLVDFRIYATALSAKDIEELYNTSLSIDNTGKSYTYEYVEK